MKWSPEAEEAVKKVPFFVRKRVRSRVEKEAKDAGRKVVSLSDVKGTKARYLSNMKSEIKGFQLDSCFGPSGCPNRAIESDNLIRRIETLLKEEDLLGFLQERVEGDLKFHHEFRVTLSDCPNACSQPQIKDIGIIGACIPELTDEPCSMCEACIDVCKEDAIVLDAEREIPQIDYQKCLECGQCIEVCPTGTIRKSRKGYRVQLGGKLGRHPKLARELPGVYSEEEVIRIIKDCIGIYKRKSLHGERFAEIFDASEYQTLAENYSEGRRIIGRS
ncbi:MAG TPA: 4Fe-4S binding protein [Deltaproteobacteria bacterium]|nr:4Fe-4S binding protein [Deltaproteobacteria bacterium]